MKKDKLITVTVTPLEASKIQACIKLAIFDDELQALKNTDEGAPDYELNEKINFYRSLIKKFDPYQF